MFVAANATVMVADMKRAVAFYTSVLELPAGMRDEDNYAEIHAPGVTIGLHPNRGHVTNAGHGNLSIGFQVEDIDEATGELSKRGIAFVRQENDTNKFAFFSDPDNTQLYLLQPKARAS